MTTKGSLSPRARIALACVLLFAFSLRVIYVLQARASPYFAEPQMDALYHVEWARAWARGEDFQPGPFFRAPLYPWFLGACLKLFGGGLLAPRIVQALLGTLATWLVYWIGARAFDRRVGWLAALFSAQYWVLIYFDGELQLPTLEVPLDLLAIGLALRCFDAPSIKRYVACGVAFGLAALVRPNILLFAPFVAAWSCFPPHERRWVPRVRAGASFVFALAAVILPITAYNAFVGGDSVLISSQAGVNLWIGNNPGSDGSTAIVPGTRADWWGGYNDSIRMAEAEEGRALKPSEVSRHYTQKALEFFREQPKAALRLLLWKARLFWVDHELGNNQDERFFAFRFGPILRWLPLGFGVIAPLGILGWVLAARRWRTLFPLWAFVPVYAASVVAFFVCSRYRVPILPPLTIFAAYACVILWEAIGARRWVRVAISVGATVVLAALVHAVPRQVDRTDANGLWQLGVHAAQHDDPARAADLYRAALAENPRFARAHQDLGFALSTMGDTEGAEESFRRSLGLDPTNVVALQGLFDVCLAKGKYDEARAAAEQSIARAPHFARGYYNAGRARFAEAEQLARRDASDARVRTLRADSLPWFQRAREIGGDDDTPFNATFAEASVQLELAHPAEALVAAEAALALRPEPDAEGWYWRCQRVRFLALRALNRPNEIARALDALRGRHANDLSFRALELELRR